VSSHATRQRAYKTRQRHGEAVLALRCEYFPLVEALLASGRISEADALERGQVESAVAEVVRDWIARWHEKG
jgi:hypothetical protein